MKKLSALLLFLFVMCAIPQNGFAQDERETEAREKIDKKKEKSQDEIRKELIKRHLKGQSKETRKRMKRAKREAERRKKGLHPKPWWERMFGTKKKSKRKKSKR